MGIDKATGLTHCCAHSSRLTSYLFCVCVTRGKIFIISHCFDVGLFCALCCKHYKTTTMTFTLFVVLLFTISSRTHFWKGKTIAVRATTMTSNLVEPSLVESSSSSSSSSSQQQQQQQPSINFLAIGDWGGQWWYPYHTPAQVKTANGMARVASEINSEFVVALGDNFYNSGITKWNSQRRLQGTFDAVYHQASLMTPWYIIGGNHDHRGNITAQIEHTTQKQQQQKNYSPGENTTTTNSHNRWQFPSLYHAHSFQAPVDASSLAVTVDLILIDTVDLCDLHSVQDEHQDGYFDPLPLLSKSFSSSSSSPSKEGGNQWDWIEHQLSTSTADYLLVGGHYPVYSVCSHGPTETLVTHLRPLLQKYNAHYLSGHDHCMVHYEEQNVNYMLTGMGDECCYDASNVNNTLNPPPKSKSLKWYISSEKQKLYQAQGGFTSFEATRDQMKVKYHDHRGNVIFEADPVEPRRRE